MAIITGITSAQGAEVDSASKAQRVTLYDSGGNEVQAPPTGSYVLPVNLRATAASAATTLFWAMRNGSSRVVSIRRISLAATFDGTAAAGQTPRYAIQRFTSATPSSGTVLTPVKKRSSYGSSTIVDARFSDTGLTFAGLVFEPEALVIGTPASVTGTSTIRDYSFEKANERYDSFELGANEGLAIRVLVVMVIGMSLTGFVAWDERP